MGASCCSLILLPMINVRLIATADATRHIAIVILNLLVRARTHPHSGQLEAYLRYLCRHWVHSVIMVAMGWLNIFLPAPATIQPLENRKAHRLTDRNLARPCASMMEAK